jgi:hypothetical protein
MFINLQKRGLWFKKKKKFLPILGPVNISVCIKTETWKATKPFYRIYTTSGGGGSGSSGGGSSSKTGLMLYLPGI